MSPLDATESGVIWIADLPEAGPRCIRFSFPGSCELVVEVDGEVLSTADRGFVEGRARWMFRADEDFEAFWRVSCEHPVLRRSAELRAGALMRSASVFEDLIKTLCTTNCHWRNTKRMVSSLCAMFGKPCLSEIGGSPVGYTFPTAGSLASASEGQLKAAGLGYRGKSVTSIARAVVAGTLDPDAWAAEQDSEKLRDEILRVPGIGPYSANHMLMLLGHYSHIPCDSEVRSYLGLPAGTDSRTVEHIAHERYGAWGKHAFLAYKLERVLANRNYVDCP